MCLLSIAFGLILQLRRIAAALISIGVALPSFALTIGRPQGSTWIGKPVDLVIPLTLEEGDGGDSLCLEAEVLQGDTRIDDKRVTVSLEPGSSATAPRMHVRSTVIVDEPVVTVAVSAGCATRSTRRYVLLADVPADIAVPGVTTSPGGRSSSNGSTGSSAFSSSDSRFGGDSNGSFNGATSGAATARRSAAPRVVRPRDPDAVAAAPRRIAPAKPPAPPRRVVVAAAPVAPPAASPVAPRTPAPAATAAADAKPAASVGPRLQLDAMEPTAARDAGLKASPELIAPPVEDTAKRAEAAALWKAVGTPSEDAQRDAQRMQTLEATLTALREQTAQNQRTLLEMRQELAAARDSRYRNPLVYALIALLLLALIGMLLLWRLAKRAAAPAWWGEAPAAGGRAPDEPGAGGMPRSAGRLPEPRAFPTRQVAAASRPAPLDDIEPAYLSGYGSLENTVVRTPDGAPVRPVNTEELFDVQQQSDFFLSLGQHDQAIAVLSEHIADNPGTSALAYLDLLRIFHSLGRRDDYARLRHEFERAFNADVPEFDKFSEAGRGLEHYRSTLARIESQWPAPGTLALIEELVFRKPGTHGDEAFDLAAYQELLLLYSVAKEVIDPDSAPPAPVTPLSFVDTFGHELEPTMPAPIDREIPTREMPLDTLEAGSPPDAIEGAPTLPDSIYGGIDDGLQHNTAYVQAPTTLPPAAVPPAARPRAPHRPGVDLDLAEFDKTAYETMPAPIEVSAPTAEREKNPHIIDFDLFDPATEAEIAPKKSPDTKR
jgi:pilus assembly protein FimV